MPFNSSLPEWNKTATAPTQTKKDAGWSASEKPPASIFNWFFNTAYLAIKELQDEAINSDQKGVNNGVAPLDATGDLPLVHGDNILNWVKGFGLGDVAKDISSTDLNSLDATGFYLGDNLTNAPIKAVGTRYFVLNFKHAATVKTQVVIRYSTTNMEYLFRHNNSGTWTTWTQLATYDATGKVAISNLPAATTVAAGIAQLSDSITDTSTTKAATANSVKLAVDWAKGFGLGDVAKDISSTDLNALDATGFYKGATLTNIPSGYSNGYIIHVKYDATNSFQIFLSTGATVVLTRRKTASAWSTWSELETTGGAQTKANTAETNATNFAKGFGLGDVAKDIINTDLNNLDATGFYRGASGLTNSPDNLAGWFVINLKHTATFKTQIATRISAGGIIYTRNNNNGVWSAWAQLATQDWAKSFGLGGFSAALASPDLNAQTTNGFYYCSGTITNGPQAANGFLAVEAASATVVKQTYMVFSTGVIYYRLNSSGTWGAWTTGATQEWVKGFGLGDIAKDISNTDLNALDVTGFYKGATLTNSPNGSTSYFYVTNMKHNSNQRMQTAWLLATTTPVMYQRVQNFDSGLGYGTWSAWTIMATTSQALPSGVSLAAATDWDTLTSRGSYKIDDAVGQGFLNTPSGIYGWGELIVFVSNNPSNVISQMYIPNQNGPQGGIWVRSKYGTSAFKAWTQMAVTTQEAWTNLTLVNSWVAYGLSHATPSFRKNNFGEIELQGVVKSGVVTAGTIIATLPSGYRPAVSHMYSVVSNNGTTDVAGRISIAADGTIRIYAGANSFLSLDDIPPISMV